MAVGTRAYLPYMTVVDNVGVPIPGALMFFYVSETDTPQNTYADAGLTVANANPVVANAAGMFPNVWLDPSLVYKVVLTDALGNEIWTADPVYGGGSGGGGDVTGPISADYIVENADEIVEVDASAANRLITVPLSRPPGSIVKIVKIDTSGNQVQISDGIATRGWIIQPSVGALCSSYDCYVSSSFALRLV